VVAALLQWRRSPGAGPVLLFRRAHGSIRLSPSVAGANVAEVMKGLTRFRAHQVGEAKVNPGARMQAAVQANLIAGISPRRTASSLRTRGDRMQDGSLGGV